MNTVNLLSNLISGNEIFAYVLIFLGMIIEGEIVLLFSGILAHIGGLDILTLFFVALLGVISKSYLGYYLGAFLKDKFPENRFFKYVEDKILYSFPNFKENPFWSIFISKFIYGLNHFTIILSGYLKINFKTFFKAEITASIIWLMEFLALGYFFSYSAIGITKDIKKFSILVLIYIVAFIMLEKFIAFLYKIFKAK